MSDSFRWISGYDTQTELTKEDLKVLYGLSPELLESIKYLVAIESLNQLQNKD